MCCFVLLSHTHTHTHTCVHVHTCTQTRVHARTHTYGDRHMRKRFTGNWWGSWRSVLISTVLGWLRSPGMMPPKVSHCSTLQHTATPHEPWNDASKCIVYLSLCVCVRVYAQDSTHDAKMTHTCTHGRSGIGIHARSDKGVRGTSPCPSRYLAHLCSPAYSH